MTDMPRQLGRYQLLRRLATGGMGEIYLARTTGAGGFEKRVIIKTILPHLARQQEFVTKFLDEGRIVVQLTHGNIVPVFDMGEEDGEYFIAMEYVPGLDLRAILKRLQAREQRLPIELALYVATELCKGLGYAHRKTDDDGNPLDIVHRDVSPSNVLVSREGEVKIIDFGIARAAGKVAETASGRIQGKCCYMSPEQARGRPLDARSDIFSTGVLLYEMLTLVRPFEGRSDLESLELVRQCEADPPGVLRPAIPEEVDAIVARAMAPKPDQRYQTIDEMHVELQQELYRLDHSVTSQRVAEFLAPIFAEAQEDDASRLVAASVAPANLDEAFELQLAQLHSPDGSPSPLQLAATATATANETNTLTPAPTPGTPLELPEARDSDASHTDAARSNGSSQHPFPSSQDSGEHQAELTPTPASQPESAPVRRRYWLPATIAATFAAVAALIVLFLLLPDTDAVVELDTEPSGASVLLDGEELAGRRTPTTLSLSPGSYELAIDLDGYDSEYRVLHLSSGERLQLDETDFRLRPSTEEPRQFTVVTDPHHATLLVDGQEVDSTPHTVELTGDNAIELAASAVGCTTTTRTLTRHHPDPAVTLVLQCEDQHEEDDEASPPDPELRAEHSPDDSNSRPPIRAPRPTVRIETSPSGASITADDRDLGTSPVTTELPRRGELAIEARLDGYQRLSTNLTEADFVDGRLTLELEERPLGCLNFRALHPPYNKIAINGEWLDDRHMFLRNHSLPAGANTITVYNPEIDRRESFDVDIEAGSDCKVLTVWPHE